LLLIFETVSCVQRASAAGAEVGSTCGWRGALAFDGISESEAPRHDCDGGLWAGVGWREGVLKRAGLGCCVRPC